MRKKFEPGPRLPGMEIGFGERSAPKDMGLKPEVSEVTVGPFFEINKESITALLKVLSRGGAVKKEMDSLDIDRADNGEPRFWRWGQDIFGKGDLQRYSISKEEQEEVEAILREIRTVSQEEKAVPGEDSNTSWWKKGQYE